MEKTKEIINLCSKYILNTYTRTPVVFTKGKGIYIWDVEGKKYLDFFPGWAVSGIGHCHKRVVASVKNQLKDIIHVSNNYYSKQQILLAEKIANTSFGGKVFFANSGAEANEAAVKLARACGQYVGKHKVITMEKSFHGRTLAMIAATGQDKVKKGFEPLPEGFVHVPFGDIAALEKAMDDKTAAVMIEPIQGEGGINIADEAYIKKIRSLCDEREALLIFDEVQTGMGRTGKLFAYQHYGIEPDVMTLAKSLGGGFPIGAMVVNDKFSDVLKPGMHASTFGGSPIVCAAALGVFEAIEEDNLLDNANKMGEFLGKRLKKLKRKYSGVIKGIKQMALMAGLELNIEGSKIVEECFNKGLLINCTQKNILRIMPPLTVKKGEITRAIKILDEVLARYR
ncbi:MAG: aspartate aminotransferase family protein [Candidatus Omnitrophica bacterium]|nr:aspartate aminotransferase family protein [Candidatus Omnitrophota bacterium]